MKKYIFITIFILSLFIGGGTLFFFLNSKEKPIMEEQVIKERKANYDIQINYPTFQDKKLSNKIKDYVNTLQKNFKKQVKDLDDSTDYELIISYDYSIVDSIYSIHFRVFYYLGGAHYQREDAVYYYDSSHKKEVYLSDLVHLDESFYADLSKLTKKDLEEKKEELSLYDTEELKEGLLPTKENFQYILFSDSVEILFPPYQVGPWSSGEIHVNIDYRYLIKYLNKEYFPSIKVTSIDAVFDGPSGEEETKRDLEALKNKKLIAFTFDDGPNYSVTENFLYALDEYQAKVSFFVLGNRAIKQPNLIKLMYSKGHTIGSHTYDHKNLFNLKEEEILYEINKTNEVLEQITGAKPRYLRPPYGNYNGKILQMTPMTFILWSVDTNDWKYKDSDRIANYIVENVKDGDIVLLHDLYQTSIEGVLKAMEMLKEEYAFVSIEELAQIKGVTLEESTAYRYIR